MATDAPWFTATPEAVIRAEQILLAFHNDDQARIGDILAADYSDDPPPGGALAVLVALICMADRAIDFAAHETGNQHEDILRVCTSILSAVAFDKIKDENTND